MIKYNLECKCGQTFESWFASSGEYDSLKRKKLIICIYCNSIEVKKTLMSPNLKQKSNKIRNNIKFERIVKKELIKFRKYIEKNCKNVGENFSQEARNIHYDKKASKGIYGKVTKEETQELLDEGIEVTTVPWIKDIEN